LIPSETSKLVIGKKNKWVTIQITPNHHHPIGYARPPTLRYFNQYATKKDILKWVTLKWGLRKAKPLTLEMCALVPLPKNILV